MSPALASSNALPRPVLPLAPPNARSAAPFPVQRGSCPVQIDLKHSGSRLLVLRWQVLGAADRPLVIVLGGISATRQLTANAIDPSPGWWPAQVRAGGALDPWQRRLLAIDWIGADGTLDCAIDPDDQAQAIVALLDHLRVDRVEACVGASYGAMVGMHLARRLGHRLGHLVALSGAHRAHPFASAWRALQRQVLRLGERRDAEPEAVGIARALAVLSYRSAEEFDQRFDQPVWIEDGRARCAAESYLAAHGQRFAARFSTTAYARLSESIDLHAIDPASIVQPVTVVAAHNDQLVPLADCRALAERLPNLRRLHVIESRYGHDTFLKEDALIHDILCAALGTGGAA